MAWDSLTPEQIQEANNYNREKSKKRSLERLAKMQSMSPSEEFMFTVENTIQDHWEDFALPIPMSVMSSRFNRSAKRHFGSWENFIIQLDVHVGVVILKCPPRSKRFVFTCRDFDTLGIFEGSSEYLNYIEMLGSNKKVTEEQTALSHDAELISLSSKKEIDYGKI